MNDRASSLRSGERFWGSCARARSSKPPNEASSTGRLKKKPWAMSHPMPFTNSTCSAVSMPSQTTTRPSTLAMFAIEYTTVALRKSERSRWKNSWSIFTSSMGRFCSMPSDEYPLPKSSMATLKPCSCSRFTWPITVSKSSTNALSVISAHRYDGGTA